MELGEKFPKIFKSSTVPQNVGHWSPTDASSYSKLETSRKSVFCVSLKLIFKYSTGLQGIQDTKYL
jgi:hypothetical protein